MKRSQKKFEFKGGLEIGNGMDIPLEETLMNLAITFGIRNFGDFERGLKEMLQF